MNVNLLDLDSEGLAAFVAELDEKPFRARQVKRWMHRLGESDFARMSDIAKPLREKLLRTACISPPRIVSDTSARDGTRKWLLDVGNGNAVETVYIPEDDRGTLCISSQAGCALECAFCSTGKQGFNRNLTTAEIVGQLWHANRALLVDGAKGHPERAPRDFVTFEYVMLDGVNDQPVHARELIALVRDVPCKLNLIPFNPFPGSEFRTSPRQRILAFQRTLMDAGIVTTVRKTRGDDIDAACGQLAGQVRDRRTPRRVVAIEPARGAPA